LLDKKKVRSKVWHPRPKTDDGKDDKPQDYIKMVVFLPKEFMVQLIWMCPMKNLAWLS
jgi:hypothetical protein